MIAPLKVTGKVIEVIESGYTMTIMILCDSGPLAVQVDKSGQDVVHLLGVKKDDLIELGLTTNVTVRQSKVNDITYRNTTLHLQTISRP